MNSSSPGPRRMQIANGLAELRRRAGLTQEDVGTRAGVSKATVSRYEDWSNRARTRWATVKGLAEACGATASEIETLVKLAKDTQDGWWVGNDAVPAWLNPLVSLEHEAAHEHVFANSVVPGLLQTRRYAHAVHQAQEIRQSAEEIKRMVDARMQRQEILKRSPPLHLWAVLDEAVLRRVVGEASVMAEQLDHLCDQVKLPNVELQVLPFTAGAHAAALGHFVIVGGPEDSLGAVYIEMRDGGFCLDKPQAVTRYRLTFDYLRSQAADTTTSLKILTAARKEYR